MLVNNDLSVDGVLGHESKDAVGAAVKESIAGLPDSAPFKTYLTGDLDKHVDLVLRYGCLLCSIRLCQGCCWTVWRTPARKIQVRQVTNVTLSPFSPFSYPSDMRPRVALPQQNPTSPSRYVCCCFPTEYPSRLECMRVLSTPEQLYKSRVRV